MHDGSAGFQMENNQKRTRYKTLPDSLVAKDIITNGRSHEVAAMVPS